MKNEITDYKTSQRHKDIRRYFRKIHKTTGAMLFIFFLIVAITGLLLGWKKHSGGLILAKTQKGVSTDIKDWLPIEELQKRAFQILHDSVSPDLSLDLDRIDIRQNKGIVKFVFENHYWGIQLDCTTGELLQIEQRRSDFIENIHDGSILDIYFGTSDGQLKLLYTSTLGLSLLLFVVTGFWLWYGPIYLKRKTDKRKQFIVSKND